MLFCVCNQMWLLARAIKCMLELDLRALVVVTFAIAVNMCVFCGLEQNCPLVVVAFAIPVNMCVGLSRTVLWSLLHLPFGNLYILFGPSELTLNVL